MRLQHINLSTNLITLLQCTIQFNSRIMLRSDDRQNAIQYYHPWTQTSVFAMSYYLPFGLNTASTQNQSLLPIDMERRCVNYSDVNFVRTMMLQHKTLFANLTMWVLCTPWDNNRSMLNDRDYYSYKVIWYDRPWREICSNLSDINEQGNRNITNAIYWT